MTTKNPLPAALQDLAKVLISEEKFTEQEVLAMASSISAGTPEEAADLLLRMHEWAVQVRRASGYLDLLCRGMVAISVDDAEKVIMSLNEKGGRISETLLPTSGALH